MTYPHVRARRSQVPLGSTPGGREQAPIALGYIRRSKESGDRTISLEDQRARIEAYCHEHSFALAEVRADDGVSGGRRERLERLAERVKATGARIVVVYHLDRFARDLAAPLDYLRRFSRRGVELHVVGRGRVEADTATGFIVTARRGPGRRALPAGDLGEDPGKRCAQEGWSWDSVLRGGRRP